MTLAAEQTLDRSRLLDQQHITIDHISWPFYEHMLDAIGNRPLRVTYDKGRIEIMAPLAEHEAGKEIIGALIETFALERDLPLARFGSTTFRRKDKQSGLEPDKCYYFANAAHVRGMKRFDPAIYPAPDLAIEVDITARSIAREPIYADLGVPEVWRYDGTHMTVLLLQGNRTYESATVSRSLPQLPMQLLESFIRRMERDDQTTVLREFQRWARALGDAASPAE